MPQFKYKYLVTAIILLFSIEALAKNSRDLEGENLIGPKSFIIDKYPKYDWEEKKPEGSMQKEKVSPVEYFSKKPYLLDKASKNLPTKIPVHKWISFSEE